MYKPKKRSRVASETRKRRRVFSYRRVSTPEQEDGGSLNEQNRVNDLFCGERDMRVVDAIEDIQTAAKSGREEFDKMIRRLRRGEADGVVFHKVDRSTRNYKDWQVISELMEDGYYIGFASDRLESTNSAGRLSMDLQAAIAIHFIRNLRDETRKGMRGRINQGLWPWGAPLGYLDRKNKLDDSLACRKTIDSKRAPLIREMFEMYASQQYTIEQLAKKITGRGLRTKADRPISFQYACKMLDRPFYAGLLPYDGQLFPGKHEPIISIALWNKVQRLRAGRTVVNKTKHDLIFRKMLQCRICESNMIGEVQKGHVYYRCHHKGAHESNSIRETHIAEQVASVLERVVLTSAEVEYVQSLLNDDQESMKQAEKQQRAAEKLKRGKLEVKKKRALDAFLSGVIDADSYKSVETEVTLELAKLDQNPPAARAEGGANGRQVVKLLERLNLAVLSQKPKKQRELLNILFSNFSVARKNVSTQPRNWLHHVLERQKFNSGTPVTEIARTWDVLLPLILADPDFQEFVEAFNREEVELLG